MRLVLPLFLGGIVISAATDKYSSGGECVLAFK